MSPARRIITVGKSEGETDKDELEARDAVVDEKLVQKSVEWIRETLAKTLHKGAMDVGGYVFDNFFDGDVERVRSRNPLKNASFRKLAERCGTPDLPISATWLYNSVNIVVMDRLLPKTATAYRQLPPSHQEALVRLRDLGKVERFAERAYKKGLSVRDLKAVVKEELSKEEKDPRGRKPKPLIIKTLSRSLKLFTLESGRKSFRKTDVEQLSDAEKKLALKTAADLINSLQNLVSKLEGK